VVEALPYLWILVFGFMALGAAYNIRHTKHGYRYSLWHILLSSVAFSLAGGFALQLFGLGYTVDHFLGQQMRAYMSQEKMEQRLWQNPTDGRLLGHLTHHTLATSSSIIFLDTIGDSWQVDVSELTQRERALVEGKGTVRLIGQISDEKVRRFHSCGAFSWVVDESMSREDMRLAREEFLLRVGGYKEQAEKVLYRDEEALEIEEGREESPCGEIAPVHRIRKAKEFDGE
jgi:hypothetical protein